MAGHPKRADSSVPKLPAIILTEREQLLWYELSPELSPALLPMWEVFLTSAFGFSRNCWGEKKARILQKISSFVTSANA